MHQSAIRPVARGRKRKGDWSKPETNAVPVSSSLCFKTFTVTGQLHFSYHIIVTTIPTRTNREEYTIVTAKDTIE